MQYNPNSNPYIGNMFIPGRTRYSNYSVTVAIDASRVTVDGRHPDQLSKLDELIVHIYFGKAWSPQVDKKIRKEVHRELLKALTKR